MFTHPQFDPIAIHLGPFGIHWYGLMYLIGFLAFLWLGRQRIRSHPDGAVNVRDLDDLLFYGVLGVIAGGRLGFVLFYQPAYFLAHPLDIPALWQGGMSFHGGFLGVLVALGCYARKRNVRWLALTDFVAPLVPVGLGAGRLGNFINGELWGRPTDAPWGVVFPSVDLSPRHPSQLYELGLEGFGLFCLLWIYSRRPRPVGAVSALFLLGYGSMRFIVEFTREPDAYLGLLALDLSLGQWLSLPMIAAGGLLYRTRDRRQ